MSLTGVLDAINNNAPVVSLLFSAVVMAATVVYVVLTYRLVKETRDTRLAANAARIGVYLEPQARWVGFLDLVVENHGPGAARDLEWELTADAETLRNRGVTALDASIFKGFAYLAPGQRIRMFFGQGPRLLAEPTPEPTQFKVTYTDESGRRLSAEFSVDLDEWKGLRQAGTPPEEKIAASLEKIAKSLAE